MPPFVGPRTVGFVLPSDGAAAASAQATTATVTTVAPGGENNCNEINVMPVGRPPKHSQLIGPSAAANGEQFAVLQLCRSAN